MKNCKYYKSEKVDGIIHEFCTNEELKKRNKSNDKIFKCFGGFVNCGEFKEKENDKAEGSK